MNKLVFAGDVRQFQNWCNDCQLDERDYKYIHDAKSIYGFRDTDIRMRGTYWTRDCYWDVVDYCKSHNIKII